MRELRMAVLAIALLPAGSAVIGRVAAASLSVAPRPAQAASVSGLDTPHRIPHRARIVANRPIRPEYYDRPQYYAPAPFVPFNFGAGVGAWR